jgi:hypothetical protein
LPNTIAPASPQRNRRKVRINVAENRLALRCSIAAKGEIAAREKFQSKRVCHPQPAQSFLPLGERIALVRGIRLLLGIGKYFNQCLAKGHYPREPDEGQLDWGADR